MTVFSSNEQKFIAEIGKFEFITKDKKESLARLESWQSELMKALDAQSVPVHGLKGNSELARQAEFIKTQLLVSMKTWAERWRNNAEARALADEFGEQAILLVFGKVNAGKSSFCNFLVDRFSTSGKTVQYFYIDAGRVVGMQERFKEGVTETTSRIQGVRLGEQLILLDTPGLHSVTEENGDLTRRFTDSADGVLWLTSSTSPGQVQELDALSRELKSSKPLLPVITRSDVYIEDELDGEITKVLCNKTRGNRQLQENDVYVRAAEKLESAGLSAALLMPVSVSAYTARAQEQTVQAIEDAGFDNLYANLLGLIQPAAVYKQRKVAEAMLHHLEENVLGTLHFEIFPPLSQMQEKSKDALKKIEKSQPRITSAVARVVIAGLPDLLEDHKLSRDVKAVCAKLSAQIFFALEQEVRDSLADYVVAMDASLAQLHPGDRLDFEDRAIEVVVRKGAAKRAAAGAAGAAGGAWLGAEGGAMAGAALGSVVPVVGTVFGGIVGGVIGGVLGGVMGGAAGSKGGEYFEETEIQRRVVGVSYETLHIALEEDVRKKLPGLVAHAVEQCQRSVRLAMQEAARLQDIISEHEHGLDQLKRELRHESA